MIGVICAKNKAPLVAEFFELFKVPWEWYVETKRYDVVIVTGGADIIPQAKLVVVCGSERKSCDLGSVTGLTTKSEIVLLDHDACQFPIYGKLAYFEQYIESILTVKGTAKIVGV